MIVPPGPFLAERADVMLADAWWEERCRAWIALGVCEGAPPEPEPAKQAVETAPEPAHARIEPPVVQASTAFIGPSGLLAGLVPYAPYCDPFLAHHADRLAAAGKEQLAFDGWDSTARGAVGMDVESFVNFFVVCFKRFADGRCIAFERSDRADFDPGFLESVLHDNVLVSFNGQAYDLPMIYLALAGAGPARLKEASDRIIHGRMKPWEVQREFGISIPNLNHIDLMEPNPSVRQGLKILQGRLHCRFLVDLPFPPDAHLTPEQRNHATFYCLNDLDATEALYEALREPLKLRAELGKIYGLELRSRSDSQVGEAIVRRRIETASGNRVARDGDALSEFGYDPPAFLGFEGSKLTDLLIRLRGARFSAVDGKVKPPAFLEDLTVSVGGANYSMGIGGLHSTEAHRALRADDDHILLDADVASQYPNIILGLGMYPRAIGPAFIDIYSELIGQRIEAKKRQQKMDKEIVILEKSSTDDIHSKITALKVERDKCKTMADGFKISTNGIFGKLGSSYSCLYSPDLLIAVTLTGQLAILMLIERAERARIPVVSANTDGVVFHCPRARESELGDIIGEWERVTGFVVEQNRYSALYNSSVNTYIAVREDGKVKRKGAIANPWAEGDLRGQMSKNPQMTVCSDALVRRAVDGIPVEETIDACTDPRAFVTVIKVTGGATWRSHSLGRAIRYYWSTDGDSVYYADGKRRVAKTDGARPLQELTDDLPADIDYARYHLEARRLAEDMKIA